MKKKASEALIYKDINNKLVGLLGAALSREGAPNNTSENPSLTRAGTGIKKKTLSKKQQAVLKAGRKKLKEIRKQKAQM